MKSIRAQLILRLLIGAALLLSAAGIVLHWQIQRALTSEFDAALRASAQSISAITEQKSSEIMIEFGGDTMPQFQRSNGADIYLVRTLDGGEVARSPSFGDATLPLRAGSPAAPDFFDVTLTDGRTMRCASLRFTPQDGEDDEKPVRTSTPLEATLTVGRDRASLDHTLGTLITGLLVVGFGALAVLAALVGWSVRSGLGPLDRLGASVAAVDASSLATRFPAATMPEELRPIATRLNELLARLEATFARERQFTATAAHELRTPLAELRALAEVNLSTPATAAENAEAWRDAHSATLRMESLALRLLDLARAQDSLRVVQRQPVVLAEAIASSWQSSADRAAERRITLTTSIPNDLTVHTDPVILSVILNNLCANAAHHAPTGTLLRIVVTSTNDVVTLQFANAAGTISATDLPHLFDRFWRKDIARTDAQHHGLGLALAAEFATLLDSTLSADLNTDGDLIFSLAFG